MQPEMKPAGIEGLLSATRIITKPKGSDMTKEKLVRIDMSIRRDAMQLIKARAKRDGVTQRDVMWWLMDQVAGRPHGEMSAEIMAGPLARYWDDPDGSNAYGIVMTHLALKHLRVN